MPDQKFVEFGRSAFGVTALKKLPSEYLKDMFYTTQPMEVPDDKALMEAQFRYLDAENTFLYASDYRKLVDKFAASGTWQEPDLESELDS